MNTIDLKRRFDAHFLVVLRVGEGQLDGLLDLLNLLIEASNVRIGLLGGLLEFHHGHHRVCVVSQHPDHRVVLNALGVNNDSTNFERYQEENLFPAHLVVEQNGASRFELFLVDEGHDVDVVLAAHIRGHDRVLVVDDLFQRAHGHRSASQLVHLNIFIRLVESRSSTLVLSSSCLSSWGLSLSWF
ncbi:hypothetical protein WR25_15849 [Diploscapter pachys]|uniref:Uncharacterized protein n=1 Tax=Diploscapter pachys TaxID=2018661 RepID=A0A2A2J7F7_9BILA|nr:hypothetical protein WR25_15849 [Diploscapter pachys]